MKQPRLQLQEIEYLPSNLINSFAKAYSRSFPELNLDQTTLVSFLNRKFPTFQAGSFHNIAVVATSDDVIASGYGIVRNGYSLNHEDFTVGLVCDVFTDSDFRKMGLFKKVSLIAIDREEQTETKFLIGFPVRDEVMPGHLSVGWRYIFDMPLWWAIPRIGLTHHVQKYNTRLGIEFKTCFEKLALRNNAEFLEWRFSLFDVDYFVISIPSTDDFAIVRKSKLKRLSFTCIVFLQSSSKANSRLMIKKIRNLSLRLGTLGVLGCWNDSYAKDLFLKSAGLKKSSKTQKVIVRELNGFVCSDDENDYQLSWLDSDTL